MRLLTLFLTLVCDSLTELSSLHLSINLSNDGTNQILLFDGIQRYELTSRSGECSSSASAFSEFSFSSFICSSSFTDSGNQFYMGEGSFQSRVLDSARASTTRVRKVGIVFVQAY